MKLKTWLKQQRVTQADFAARMDVRRETVIRWCKAGQHGGTMPDMPTINMIAEKTEGAVTALDWAEQERTRTSERHSPAEAS